MGDPGDWKRQCYDTATQKGWPLCIWNLHCLQVQDSIDTYCSGTEKTPGTPVPQAATLAFVKDDGTIFRGHIEKQGFLDMAIENPNEGIVKDPYIQVGRGKVCWCCCSCFAFDTPIEARPGMFVFIQDINVGDKVMTTGLDLNWKETEVKFSSGIGPKLKFPFMHYLTYKCEGEEENHEIIITADHLFLMASGKLKPVQNIIPGNKLLQADGKTATVVFCIVGEYEGGLHHIHTGEFDGKTLDGHLVNANGLICADYMVQLCYSSGGLESNLLTEPPQNEKPLEVGTAKYQSSFGSVKADEFISKPELWPKGFKPHKSNMISVPSNAHSYLTKEQAEDIMNNASHAGPGYGERLESVKYLFRIYKSFYPGIVYLFDWDNEFPNAYTWDTMGQKIILITGGLVRIIGLDQEGLALILSHLVAVCRGKTSVGPADYEAVFFVLREVWNDLLYANILSPALEQIEKLFKYVSDHHAAEDPDDIGSQPSLECRMKTYNAASSMMPIPDCAVPKPASFGVKGAKATIDLKSVIVSYDHRVDKSTAEKVENYTITPEGKIASAVVNPHNHSLVRLFIDELKLDTDYVLTVKDVLSRKGTPLSPNAATARFHTSGHVNVGLKTAKK